MSERVAGKTFSTPEEAGVEAPTPEEIREFRRMLDEAQRLRDAVAPEDRIMMGPKFYDDIAGTEFEQR
ncbi:hypothetical protein [Nocardia sp. NPDC058497]|uniref:hypothetical protein n=1 Tax=Nocardia sp. NPDC058497 TaxID=3346529 RepID=UPI00365E14BB